MLLQQDPGFLVRLGGLEVRDHLRWGNDADLPGPGNLVPQQGRLQLPLVHGGEATDLLLPGHAAEVGHLVRKPSLSHPSLERFLSCVHRGRCSLGGSCLLGYRLDGCRCLFGWGDRSLWNSGRSSLLGWSLGRGSLGRLLDRGGRCLAPTTLPSNGLTQLLFGHAGTASIPCLFKELSLGALVRGCLGSPGGGLTLRGRGTRGRCRGLLRHRGRGATPLQPVLLGDQVGQLLLGLDVAL